MNPVTYDILTRRVKQLGHLPAMPAILSTLTTALTMPAGKIDLDHISETIAYDKSLTAQVLRLPTPLYSANAVKSPRCVMLSSLSACGAFVILFFRAAFP